MNRPWMPLYVADYRADTAHLSAAQHGAYLLLIMHYWQTGSLPIEDAALARISCMLPAEWRKAREVVAAFFTPAWKHKRIDAELARAADVSSKRRAAAEQRHSKSYAIAPANAELLDTHARTCAGGLPSQSERKKDAELRSAADAAPAEPVDEDLRAKLFRVGKTILVSFGVGEKRTGSLIGQWLKSRNDPEGLLAAIQFARDQNVAEPVAYVSALVSKNSGKSNGQQKLNLSDLAAELADEARSLEREAGLFRSNDVVGRA